MAVTAVGGSPIGGSGSSFTALMASIAAAQASAGDGADGDVTIAGTVTLTRPMYYRDLVVPAGTVLITRGFRVFARKITIDVGGIVHCNGNNAVGAVGGTAYAAGDLANNIAGVNGVAAAAPGAAGANAGSCVLPRAGALGSVFRGGAGGSSVGGANAGGLAGTVTLASTNRWSRSNPETGASMNTHAAALLMTPASSGGAGAGDGVNAGGGSGAGGGHGFMRAGEVINNGQIQALGGNGGNAAGGNAGGGGPGGGGWWQIECGSFSGNNPECTAGSPGSGLGTGLAGALGNNGDYSIVTYKP